MNKLFFILFFISSHLLAEEMLNSEMWSIGNRLFEMVKTNTGYLISRGCEKQKGTCLAFQSLNPKKEINLTEAELKGGKSPGSVRCKKLGKTEILILKDLKGNENAFCYFSDGSLISASALQ